MNHGSFDFDKILFFSFEIQFQLLHHEDIIKSNVHNVLFQVVGITLIIQIYGKIFIINFIKWKSDRKI